MNAWIDLLLILLVLANLSLVALSRLGTCIRVVALQGVLLGLLTASVHGEDPPARLVLLAIGSIALKGLVFPRLLLRAVREADVRREVEPFVGYGMSILIATLALPATFWLSSRLPPVGEIPSSLVMPAAFHAILVGLFVIISRRKAITQVLGYLVLENGIYTFGVAMVQDAPFLVEVGVLLDVFVAVFVMGIAVFHIHREFDHIDTDRLSVLRD